MLILVIGGFSCGFYFFVFVVWLFFVVKVMELGCISSFFFGGNVFDSCGYYCLWYL